MALAESTFGLIEGVNGLLFALGWLLFGIAVFRARGLPREGAICAVSGAVTIAVFEMLPLLEPREGRVALRRLAP